MGMGHGINKIATSLSLQSFASESVLLLRLLGSLLRRVILDEIAQNLRHDNVPCANAYRVHCPLGKRNVLRFLSAD